MRRPVGTRQAHHQEAGLQVAVPEAQHRQVPQLLPASVPDLLSLRSAAAWAQSHSLLQTLAHSQEMVEAVGTSHLQPADPPPPIDPPMPAAPSSHRAIRHRAAESSNA